MPDQLFDSLTDDITVRPLPAAELRRRGDRRRIRQQVGIGIGAVAAVAAIVVPITLAHGSSERSAPPVATSPTALTEVPAGFPLADGMPARDGVSGKPVQAGPLTTEVERPCGQVVWSGQRPIPTVGGASVEYHDASEGGLSRSLALYSDAERAEQALRYVESALEVCSVDTGSGTTVTRVPFGSDVWVVRWTDGAGQYTGEGMVSSVSRVGNALLLDSATFGSAGSDAIVLQEAARLADRSAGVVSAMCVFAGDCSSASTAASRTSSSDVLGPSGYRSLRIGTSYREAVASDDLARSEDGTSFVLAGHPDAGLCLSRKGGLMAIFLGNGMHTPEGVTVGSSVAELTAAYPDLQPRSDGPVGGPGIFRADAENGDWYEIDVDQSLHVSTVILRQDQQTCFE